MGRGLCLIEKDQIKCPKFGHVEIKIVSDSDSDKTVVKVWTWVHVNFESGWGSSQRDGFVVGFRKPNKYFRKYAI